MSILCKLLGHVADTYASQVKICTPYHDGIGRAHRTVYAKCARCGAHYLVGSTIDPLQQQERKAHG